MSWVISFTSFSRGVSILLVVLCAVGCSRGDTKTQDRPAVPTDGSGTAKGGDESLKTTLYSARWIAYAPTSWDPEKGVYPSDSSIRSDLVLLHQYFDGLITYEASMPVVRIAQEVGFDNMILGIWNPDSDDELLIAEAASESDVIKAYVIGNEGLDERYDLPTLTNAIELLAQKTGKPVTTTEQYGDYLNPRVMEIGDWVFPNTHAYFHGYTDPIEAAEWTERQYLKLAQLTTKPILFKEVGLPSGGDDRMSENAQATYYRELQKTSVKFAYFEAFDQLWKDHPPIEPYWGLFRSDRTPKEVVKQIKPILWPFLR